MGGRNFTPFQNFKIRELPQGLSSEWVMTKFDYGICVYWISIARTLFSFGQQVGLKRVISNGEIHDIQLEGYSL